MFIESFSKVKIDTHMLLFVTCISKLQGITFLLSVTLIRWSARVNDFDVHWSPCVHRWLLLWFLLIQPVMSRFVVKAIWYIHCVENEKQSKLIKQSEQNFMVIQAGQKFDISARRRYIFCS